MSGMGKDVFGLIYTITVLLQSPATASGYIQQKGLSMDPVIIYTPIRMHMSFSLLHARAG